MHGAGVWHTIKFTNDQKAAIFAAKFTALTEQDKIPS